MGIAINPSILSADFANLQRELERMRGLAQVLVPPGFLASLLEAVDTPAAMRMPM